jgi:hypothetical protein
MKTIALSMIFSLAVIVCEQQTLFAPHYSDWNGAKRTAVSKSSSQNSLVPVAGVDRLVPLAGTGDSLIAIIAIAAAQVDKDPSTSTGRFRGCIPTDTDSHSAGSPDVIDPGAGKWIDCPPYDPCDDPAFYNDGAFLPWHRG